MSPGALWKYGKIILVVALACGLVAAVEEYRFLKKENARIVENATQERKADSIGFSKRILTQKETIEELTYNRQDLVKRLDSLKIDLKQIQSLVTTKTVYSNSVDHTYELSKIMQAIKEMRPEKQSFVDADSTGCHVIKGYVYFNGKDIELNITDRQFQNQSDIVAYVEKVGLRFWKWFRKKKVTVTVLNSCGQTTTKIINVKRK